MAKLNEYYEKKNLLQRLSDELKDLEESESLQSDLEFESKVRALMKEHDKDPRDVVKILSVIDPTITMGSGGVSVKRAPRSMKTYKNPHTGEVVKTKGGNHKTLKEWREEYGKEAVKSWQQDD